MPVRSFSIWWKWKRGILTFIGNDIVDLTDPGNIGKSGDDRFLQRVFTNTERTCIAAAAAPDMMLWALWAAKETAYKIANKVDLLAIFTPRLYPVVLSPGDDGPALSGMVDTPQGQIAVRVSIAPDYLHCIGATPLPGILDHVLWDIERLSPAKAGGYEIGHFNFRQFFRDHVLDDGVELFGVEFFAVKFFADVQY